MSVRMMEQAIEAINRGNKDEGAHLLRIALNSTNPPLEGALRATAYLWLAETKSNIREKIDLHREALEADPNNDDIRKRLARLMAMSLPPPADTGATPIVASPAFPNSDVAPPAVPPASQAAVFAQSAQPQAIQSNQPNQQDVNTFYRVLGIMGGPNGIGTGFFVTQDGIVATTRFVVGGVEQVTVELEPGKRIPGRVVRSYPDIDLAFISTGVPVRQLLPFSLQPSIPDDMPLTAVSYGGKVMNGQRRMSVGEIREEWFTTTISRSSDAGGNPVFDERNVLVGMLTRNANRTSNFFYGLSIHAITRSMHNFQSEARDGANRTYCINCGYLARAGALGGFYCELCGSVLPNKQSENRFPLALPQLEGLYGENMNRPCPNPDCRARAGYYNSVCLRCGVAVGKDQSGNNNYDR
ncbi:MAG: serine protease [Aggregatilineales bacterium]